VLLWPYVQSSECGQVCETVAKSTEYFPPQLAGQGRGFDDVIGAGEAGQKLDGSWASRRCESRPYGIQLTRHYQFSEMDDTWSSRHSYFSDLSCKRPLYSLDVAGVFHLHRDEPSPLLDDAYHIDFNVSSSVIETFSLHFRTITIWITVTLTDTVLQQIMSTRWRIFVVFCPFLLPDPPLV